MLLDAGLHDTADFTPIKAGVYDFVIKKPMDVVPVVDAKTDIGGKVFTFIIWPEILGGEYAGKEVRRQFSNGSKGARYYMKSFFEKIGVVITKEGAFNSSDLLGKRFRAAVGERSYTDKNDGSTKKASDLDTESAIKI